MNDTQAAQYVKDSFHTGNHQTGSWTGDSQAAMDCAVQLIGERVGQWYEAQNGVKYFVSDCGKFCLSLWQSFPRAFVCRYTV